MEALEKFGTFDKGIFYRNDDPAPGERKNQDSFEAVWEHINQRKLEYPKPRYDEPVLMRPQNFEWLATDQAGLAIKPLGCFTERRVDVSLLKLAAGAHIRIAPRPGKQVAFITDGSGRVSANDLRQHSAFSLDVGEGLNLIPRLEWKSC